MAFPIVRWAAKPIDEPEHGGRREDSAGDRAHLRDDEQRREDADEHDRAHDDAAHDAVASRRFRRELFPGHRVVDELRASTPAMTIAAAAMTALSQKGMGGFYSGSRRLRPAKPSSSPCQCVISSSPSRQQSRISSPARTRGEIDQPLVDVLHDRAAAVDGVDAARDLTRARCSASFSSWTARGSSPPPFPAIFSARSSRRAASCCCSLRRATSSSTSGRMCASSSFASFGVKCRGTSHL